MPQHFHICRALHVTSHPIFLCLFTFRSLPPNAHPSPSLFLHPLPLPCVPTPPAHTIPNSFSHLPHPSNFHSTIFLPPIPQKQDMASSIILPSKPGSYKPDGPAALVIMDGVGLVPLPTGTPSPRLKPLSSISSWPARAPTALPPSSANSTPPASRSACPPWATWLTQRSTVTPSARAVSSIKAPSSSTSLPLW